MLKIREPIKAPCWIEGTIYGQGSTCRCRSGRHTAHWQETRSISAVKTGLGECPKKRGSPENKNLDIDRIQYNLSVAPNNS
jgi:CRISPR/Cas system CMR-associated protein Cmr1 (group 7 of RAMP superfamily)